MRSETKIIGVLLIFLLSGSVASGAWIEILPGDSYLPPRNQGEAPIAIVVAPTIAGSPDTTVLAGEFYAFSPSAYSTSGGPLTFSIRNLPRWADFDVATGRLSGQVLLGDVGVYTDIEISVFDGNTSQSLPAFSITVTQSAVGSMTLSWIAPIENSDGTPLTNLAGFIIRYGRSMGNYPNRIEINNPSIDTYLVENLLPGTYYVVAKSFNAQGVKSTFSNVAVKTVVSD